MGKHKNEITILSIVTMNVLAILGLRWFMFAAKYGAASILIWIIAAILFFIPISLICAEFGAVHPDKEAAITDWVKAELGEKAAFFASWFYLITQFFYLPTLLTFTGVCIAYVIDPNLAENKFFITLFIVISFWGMLFLCTKSLEIFKKTSEANCYLGTFLPIAFLILAAVVSVVFLKNKIPTDFSAAKWIPNFNSDNLLFIVGVGTAMGGAEVSAPFLSKMRNPQKDFPKAIIIAAVAIVICYIIGTLSILFVISPSNFSTTDGLLKVIDIVFSQVHMKWVASVIFVLIALGNLGGVVLWLTSPTKMFIDGNDPRIFPKFILKKTNDNLPLNAMILQGIFITFIVLVGNFLPSVAALYEVLVMASSILLFITYMFLVIAYLRMKFTRIKSATFEIPGKKTGAVIASLLALILCFVSVIVPIISIPSGNNPVIYEFEVVGGPIILLFLGYLLFRREKSLPSLS